MTDETRTDIETVEEVIAVEREVVSIYYHVDEKQVQLLQTTRFGGDVQSISFPADKAPLIADAILAAGRAALEGNARG